MTNPQYALIRDRILERQNRAVLATQGPWSVAEEVDGVRHGRKTVVMAVTSFGVARIVTVDQTRTHHDRRESPGRAEDNVLHIALNDPPRVRRDCLRDLRVWERHHPRLGFVGVRSGKHPDYCRYCSADWPCIEAKELFEEYEVPIEPEAEAPPPPTRELVEAAELLEGAARKLRKLANVDS